MFDNGMVIAVTITIIVEDVILLWKCFLIFQKIISIFQNGIMVIVSVFYLIFISFVATVIVIIAIHSR